MNNDLRITTIRRVRRYVALAVRSQETKRMTEAVALPLAGFIALVSLQLAILSANGELTLSAAAPVVWLTLAFTGLLAVFMSSQKR